MAWRDSRRNQGKLFLFTSSIILGIAALVAINSFGINLKKDIEDEAKTLLGADLVLTSGQPFTGKALKILDTLRQISLKEAKEINFASMIYFPKTKSSRLVQIKAMEGDYPFYGSIESNPEEASQTFQQKQTALVTQTIMMQFEALKNDTVKIGKLDFLIEGEMLKAPGQTNISASIAPVVYIPLRYVESTGLLQKGSRINYVHYFQFAEDVVISDIISNIRKDLQKESISFDTVARRKAGLGRIFDFVSRFFNLVAFVALLLGCLGVASSVHIYIKEKNNTIAILRCIGLTGSQAFYIFLIQVLSMGFIGSLIGTILGNLLQLVLPFVFRNFLPVEVTFSIAWEVVFQAMAIGVGIAFLFALIPLLGIRGISPLRALRASFEEGKNSFRFVDTLVYLLIFAFIFSFAYLQTEDLWEAGYFTTGILFSFLFLAGVAKLMVWLVRNFFPISWNYLWRQALANLQRPNNQTLILIVSIGLGTLFINTLYLIQNLLLNQIAFADRNQQANMILFDIQSSQKKEIADFTRKSGFPVMQEVPIVTTRLHSFKGKTRLELLNDTSDTRLPRDVINREYRITYRDTLSRNEKLGEGETQQISADSIFITMHDLHAERMEAKIGDEVVFDVQGTLVKTYIGGIRKIEFNRVETSFTIVFPTGTLEDAPQFHVLITRMPDNRTSAEYQQAIVNQYPNVSMIDLDLILKTVDQVLGQISFVIQFIAMFSILTGLIVLFSSILLSKYQRIQESVLLRTLGASRKQILYINALEYFFLGSLASLTGILLALLSTYLLAVYIFEIPYEISLLPSLFIYFIITLICILIGLFNSREILNKSPLEILREEN